MISSDRVTYVGIAVLVALAIWFVRKTGTPFADDKPKPRSPIDRHTAELLRARKTILRQIEEQQSFAWRPSTFKKEGVDRLKAILREIDAELAETASPHQSELN